MRRNESSLSKTEYDRPVEIAEGIYWIGFLDDFNKLHCNPYIIIDGDEAVIIDGGSRPDFSSVMLKILQTGVNPVNIKRLIYQHYDPDLCGSVANFEDIISNEELKIISQKDNNIFIRYYGTKSPLLCVEKLGLSWSFSSGRKLQFIMTPYAHSPGSFTTYDEKTGTLFSSDLFGSYDEKWDLLFEFEDRCITCRKELEELTDSCEENGEKCCMKGFCDFHRNIMTSGKALRYALEKIQKEKIKIVAPQHGSVLKKQEDIEFLIRKLGILKNVGIDFYD